MAAFIRLLWIQFDLFMMVIHVDFSELQQSIDVFSIAWSRMHFQSIN